MPTHTPWAGLAALVAMFLLPFLPSWLFEGPRTIRHWPRRHICGACGAPWTGEHTCTVEANDNHPALRGELRRTKPRGELERRRPAPPAVRR
jgi:hypothetical protein